MEGPAGAARRIEGRAPGGRLAPYPCVHPRDTGGGGEGAAGEQEREACAGVEAHGCGGAAD